MPDIHARLAPSAAVRWIACPGSVRAIEALPPERRQQDSPYAREGTAAHTLGEMKASLYFGKITDVEYAQRYRTWADDAASAGYDLEEMSAHTDAYVRLLAQRLAALPHSQILLERRVHPGVPECWGTADAIIVSPEHVEIVDLKYGQGVRVDPTGNPQLMLYGLGALEDYGSLLGDPQHVYMTVFQPRLRGHVSTDSQTPEELRAWRSSIIPIAEEALAGSDRFNPSDEACRFCPLAGTCRARMDMMLENDFGKPTVEISEEEMGDLLERIPGIRRWCSSVEEAALDRAYRLGTPIPGWKPVQSGGQRKINDQAAAGAALAKAGYAAESVFTAPKLLGLGALDKLVGGGAKLADLLGNNLGYTKGRVSMVPQDDDRPTVSPTSDAQNDFSAL